MTPMTPRPSHAPLPYGVRDLFLREAAAHAALRDCWRALFARWAYTEVITPTYEHYDVLLRGYGADQEADLYRVLDREGAVLALRPDMTTQVARLAGAKLAQEPRPLRFSYVTNVFRYDEPQAGRQREFFQAGVELIGAATAQADAEIIELCVEALRCVGLRDFQLNLGHMGLFRGLMEGLPLRPGQVANLRRAIDRKDHTNLARLLGEYGVEAPLATLVCALPRLCGGPEVLAQAGDLLRAVRSPSAASEGAAQPSMRPVDVAGAASEHLATLYRLLQARGIAQYVILDLGEVRGMGYYTGINFEGFVAGIAFPICSGGRYDNLVGLYGPPSPAVGFALGVERIQMALEQQGHAAPAIEPDLLVSAAAAEKARSAIQKARARGLRVAVDPLLAADDALLAYAAAKAIPRLLLDGGDVAVIVERDRQRPVAWLDVEEALGL